MSLNQAVVGRSYASEGSFEVSREHLRRFADAIGDGNPAYRDPDAARGLGHADVIAPPTYLTTIGLSLPGKGALDDPDLGVQFSRLVHGEQRFVLLTPVVAGMVLSMSTTVESIHAAGANEFISMVSEIRDQSGALIATGHNLVVSRGTATTSPDHQPT